MVYAREVLRHVCPAAVVALAGHDWPRLGWAYGSPLSVCKWSVEPQLSKAYKQSKSPGRSKAVWGPLLPGTCNLPLLSALTGIFLSEGLEIEISPSFLQLFAMVRLCMFPKSRLRRKDPSIRAIQAGPVLGCLRVLSLVLYPQIGDILVLL